MGLVNLSCFFLINREQFLKKDDDKKASRVKKSRKERPKDLIAPESDDEQWEIVKKGSSMPMVLIL